MTQSFRGVNTYFRELLQDTDQATVLGRLKPRKAARRPNLHHSGDLSADIVDAHWRLLEAPDAVKQALADSVTREQAPLYSKNIENFVGTVKVPVGVAGPIRVNGLNAQGDYYLPLATSEAALVASYGRGAAIISAVGGCSAAVMAEGVSRAPGFQFRSVSDAGLFVYWISEHVDEIRKVADGTTQHGRLMDIAFNIEGNHVYVLFTYQTGDASGQNMVTFATEAACQYVLSQAPVSPERWFIEANMSGDKKATAQSFQSVRGRKVCAEVHLPGDVVENGLHTSPAAMTDYWRMSALGGVLSGSIGVQGHFSNGLAALFIATGQDAATVSEAAVGITRMEMTADGGLYASVTLPNLIVGTVGGGTDLPSQSACLELMGLKGSGHARAFAEVAGALCLAGELSIIGALSAGHFSSAHHRFAREKRET